MSLNFEGVTRIVMAGRPVVKVPAGMTVEATLAALQYKVEDYEASVSGETLTLALPSGSKGALPDVRVLEDGRVVPLGNSTFPTDDDIDIIAAAPAFAKDNLLETLTDPAKLAVYAQFIRESVGDRESAAFAKVLEDRKSEFTKAREALDYLEKVSSVNDEFGTETYVNAVNAANEIVELADAVTNVQVLEIKAARAKEEDDALRAQVRGTEA